MDKTSITFNFKSAKVKKAFKIYATEKETTVQRLIEDAMKEKYPELFKTKK
jgi:hypothetical protein